MFTTQSQLAAQSRIRAKDAAWKRRVANGTAIDLSSQYTEADAVSYREWLESVGETEQQGA